MKKQDLRPVVLILAGGKGERFWPRTSAKQPKPLHKIYSSKTLLEETWQRASSLTSSERIFIGCDLQRKQAILKSHPKIPKSSFIIEPQGRNTAAIIALATLELENRFPKAIHIVLPADHYITSLTAFQISVKKAIQIAQKNFLVLLGVTANHPTSQYGYIHAGKRIADLSAKQVLAFKEKPTLRTAKKYLQQGNYFWNSGIFIWDGQSILSEFALHAKQILEPIESALKPRKNSTVRVFNKLDSKKQRLSRAFQKIPNLPIDVAILEKSNKLAMVTARFTWNDLGSWDSLDFLKPTINRDINGNLMLVRSKTKLASLESTGNIIAIDNGLVALLGIENIVAVQGKEVLFLAHRKYLPRLKEFLRQMNKNPSLQKYLS